MTTQQMTPLEAHCLHLLNRAVKLETLSDEMFEYADDLWAAAPCDEPDSPAVVEANRMAREAQDYAGKVYSVACQARAAANEAVADLAAVVEEEGRRWYEDVAFRAVA